MLLDFIADALAPDLSFPPLFGRAKRTTLPVAIGSDDGSGRPVKMIVEVKFKGYRGRGQGVVLASHEGIVYLARSGKKSEESIPVVVNKIFSLDLTHQYYPEVWAVRKSATKKTGLMFKDSDFQRISDAITAQRSGPFLGS